MWVKIRKEVWTTKLSFDINEILILKLKIKTSFLNCSISHSFANHRIIGRIHVKNEQSKLALDRDDKSHGRMNE